MRIRKSVLDPIRQNLTWEERWRAEDGGLIGSWEKGREKRIADPELAAQAANGQLVVLPWKGGVEKEIKKKQKFGTLFYLAMWQGLRGEDLDIDAGEEVSVTCSVTGMVVIFTGDFSKYAEA